MDDTVAAVPEETLPTACAAAGVATDAADVAAEPADVAAESAGPLADVAELVAAVLDGDPEPATDETAVWVLEAACPAAEDAPAVAETALAAALPEAPSRAVVALGLVAADADLVVRRDKTKATPMAAVATPAAHKQYRRIFVTSPLVITSNLIRSGLVV